MVDGVRALIDAEKSLRKPEPRPKAELPVAGILGVENTMPELNDSSTDINFALPAINPNI